MRFRHLREAGKAAHRETFFSLVNDSIAAASIEFLKAFDFGVLPHLISHTELAPPVYICRVTSTAMSDIPPSSRADEVQSVSDFYLIAKC